MTKHKFSGTGVALITPFKSNKEIDYQSLEKIINHVIDNGIDYIVTLGTTGETPTLSPAEKQEVARFTVQTVAQRTPIVVGIGSNNTAETINAIRNFDLQGIDGILSITPYYNKPNQEGIYQHYKAIGEASPLPVIAYNVPGRTGVNMTAETTLRIAADCPNIVAIKEASGNLTQIMQILQNRPEHFLVLSGDDSLTYPMMALGADGVISVAAQAVPKTFSDMVHFALDGEFAAARQNHYQVLDLMEALFADGSPAGVKTALHLSGLCENELRLPLVPVNEKVFKLIQHLVNVKH
ncbi:MAG: 4-hydroxy-tetrahydrodipicolinate synthase [Bacteroidales bacterium]|nr:4-hydroxy-tetrahydrodipicolinate synthase [Bacteroidales bacterium]